MLEGLLFIAQQTTPVKGFSLVCVFSCVCVLFVEYCVVQCAVVWGFEGKKGEREVFFLGRGLVEIY